MLIVSDEDVQSFAPPDALFRILVKGRFTVILSDEYTVHETGHDLLIYHGDCASRTGDTIVPSELQVTELITRLQSGDGYFFLMKINERGIDLYRSLEREQDVFYSTSGFFCISSRIEVILAVSGEKAHNTEFLKAYLNGLPEASFLSPFENIKKIPGGCKTSFLNGSVYITPFIILTPHNKIHLDEMSEIIYNRTRNKNIFLNFSSGLDSTLIFLLLKEAGLHFEAVHHGPHSTEHDSEIQEASHLCNKYGVRLHVMTPVQQELHAGLDDNYSGGTAFLNTEYVSDTFSYADNSSVKNIYLNGQGGDTLYVQNPTCLIGTQLLLKARPLRALRALDNLSKLKTLSLPGLIKKSLFALREVRGGSEVPVHPLLALSSSEPADYEHLLQVLSFIETLPQMTNDYLKVFSPIMTPGAIRTWLPHQYEMNFNANHDRFLIRDLAYKRFREEHVWKRRKRSSVNLAHGLLVRSRDILSRALENEQWIKATGFEQEELDVIVRSNLNGHFDNNTNMLVSLITLHEYYSFITKARRA